jgi:hypothetical protein
LNKRKTDAEIEKLLREEIRRRATNEFFEAMDCMAGVTVFRYHRSTVTLSHHHDHS